MPTEVKGRTSSKATPGGVSIPRGRDPSGEGRGVPRDQVQKSRGQKGRDPSARDELRKELGASKSAKRSGSFRLPSVILRSLQSSGVLSSKKTDEPDDVYEGRGRGTSRYLDPSRKRAASSSPAPRDDNRKGLLKGLPAPLCNLLGLYRPKSMSIERTVPMRPIRKPGPVGKCWVRMYDDILFMDEVSESEAPILGYTGHPTVVPEAEPLPKAPTPPPMREKEPEQNSKRLKTESDDKENVDATLESSISRPSRNRYKGKKQKRSGTPHGPSLNEDTDTQYTSETTEDDYIIPETAQPAKPSRSHKTYDRITSSQDTEKGPIPSESDKNVATKQSIKLYDKFVIKVDVEEVKHETDKCNVEEENADKPLKPKRGVKIYDTIQIGLKLNNKSDEVNINDQPCQPNDKMDVDNEGKQTEVPQKPQRTKNIYEKIKDTKKENTEKAENTNNENKVNKENKTDENTAEITTNNEDNIKIETEVIENNTGIVTAEESTIKEDTTEIVEVNNETKKDPIYSTINKINQSDVESCNLVNNPPPVPPKKRKFKDNQFTSDTSYDVLPPRKTQPLPEFASNNQENKVTMPRKKSKKIHEINTINTEQKSVFRNHQERPLPAPPRRKKIEKCEVINGHQIMPTPPPKRKRSKQRSHPNKSKEENENNSKISMNESFSISDKDDVVRGGCDVAINEAFDTELENNLRNIENSFFTIDSVVQSLRKHASHLTLDSIEIENSSAIISRDVTDNNRFLSSSGTTVTKSSENIVAELPVTLLHQEISVFKFPEHGEHPVSSETPISTVNFPVEATGSTQTTPRAVTPAGGIQSSVGASSDTIKDSKICPESPVSIVSYYSAASHISPSDNSECSTSVAYYSAPSESGAESPSCQPQSGAFEKK